MKKFFTIIAFASAFIPAAQGVETSIPTDAQNEVVQEQFKLINKTLKGLIQDADEQSFKKFFNPWSNLLPADYIVELGQTVLETKNKISAELNAKDCKDKNWSKIAKGALATIGAGWVYVSLPVLAYDVIISRPTYIHINERITLLNAPTSLPIAGANLFASSNLLGDVGTMTAFCMVPFLYYGLLTNSYAYGVKNLKAGWNYKQHLQDQITNLDAIAAHIAQAK